MTMLGDMKGNGWSVVVVLVVLLLWLALGHTGGSDNARTLQVRSIERSVIDEGDDYNDPESTEQPSDSDKRNSSNTELNFEYTQDVD